VSSRVADDDDVPTQLTPLPAEPTGETPTAADTLPFPPQPPPGPGRTPSGTPAASRAPTPPGIRPDPLVGQVVIGQFRIVRCIGRGGFGAVYLADQVGVDRRAVVKFVRPVLAGSPVFVERFHREARVLALLDHHHLCKLYNFGEHAGRLFLAMEYGGDRTLADEIQRAGRLPAEYALGIASQICDALQEAHQRGIVHRDLKPANVLLGSKGDETWVKVVDVGIAKLLGGEGRPGGELTNAGTVLGTPAYFSPEQARGDPIDGRSDLYSAGIVLYEMLTGALPIRAATPIDFIRAHNVDPPLATATHGVRTDPEVEAILRKALAKAADDRFQSAAEMAAAIRAAQARRVPASRAPSRRRSPLVAAILTAAVVLAAGISAVLVVEQMHESARAPAVSPPAPAAVPPSQAPAAAGKLLFRAPGTDVFVRGVPGIDPRAANPEIPVVADEATLAFVAGGHAVEVSLRRADAVLHAVLRATAGDTLSTGGASGTEVPLTIGARAARVVVKAPAGAEIPVLCRFAP